MDIKKGKIFHFFGEITIKASPPIYIRFLGSIAICLLTIILMNAEPIINKPAAQAAGADPPPAEAPPIGKIRPFSKMAVTFEPLMGF